MSLLFIGYQTDKQYFTTVPIMRKVAKFLFSNVIEPLAKTSNDENFLDKAHADLLDDNVDFSTLTQSEFKYAYRLVEKHSSEPILKYYVNEILTNMKADPRFQS